MRSIDQSKHFNVSWTDKLQTLINAVYLFRERDAAIAAADIPQLIKYTGRHYDRSCD